MAQEVSDAVLLRLWKTCTKCGLDKQLGDYSREKRSPDGRKAKCKACETKLKLQWRQNGGRETWRTNRRERHEASVMVRRAVRSGKLVKPDRCQKCMAKVRLHGHHSDYTKPLEVDWWCSPCHREHHRLHGPAKGASDAQ